MEDFAYDLVEQGAFGEIPDSIANYLDYEKIARDLSYDYWEEDGHIFRNV
jgi:antirestriction protein